MWKFLVAGLFAVGLAGRANAQAGTPRLSEIAVSGRSEIAVAADHALLVVSVENNSNTATASAAENARLVAATINSLRGAGVKDSEITNSGYSLNQEYENGDSKRPRKFFARNSIRIEVPRIADVGKLIDAAIAGGATSVQPIQYLGTNMREARREALKAAVEEARRDAETLASAAGGSLGRLLSMQSGFNNQIAYRGGEAVATGAVQIRASLAAPTSIKPSDVVVVAAASGVWEFMPRQ